MARYAYTGPGPQEDGDGLVRPGDEREFGSEPDWGPWELIEGVPAKPDDSGNEDTGNDGAQTPATPPGTPASTPPPASTATASTTAPAATSAPVPKTGM